MTRLLVAALGAAPRERILVDVACTVLCVAGLGLLGAAAFDALAEAAGAQVARVGLGTAAFALAGLVWAVGALRMRQRARRAAAARAQLVDEVRAATLGRAPIAGPALAFAHAFFVGRKAGSKAGRSRTPRD